MVFKRLDRGSDPRAAKAVCCVGCFFFRPLYRNKKIPLEEDDSSLESILDEIKHNSPGGFSFATMSTAGMSFHLSDIAADNTLLGELDTSIDSDLDSDIVDFAMPWENPSPYDDDDDDDDADVEKEKEGEEEDAKLEFRPIKDYRLRPGETLRITLPKQKEQQKQQQKQQEGALSTEGHWFTSTAHQNMFGRVNSYWNRSSSEASNFLLRASVKDTRYRTWNV